MAIAAMILGIATLVWAIIPAWGWMALITGIPGIILGALAKKKPEKQGMATAGLVMSIIGLVLGLLFFFLCVACIACNGGLDAIY